MKKGEKIGMKKGMEKGREEGRKEGREEGRKEAALDVARILKQQGLDPSIIALSTGLSVSVIEEL
jgi:predicted transposase/invertase (TIGR01784 family)